MSDINKVIVTGRVTRDSELRQTPNGTSVTDVSVASNRIWSKNGDFIFYFCDFLRWCPN